MASIASWHGRRHAVSLHVGVDALASLLAMWQAWRTSSARCERLHLIWIAQPGEHAAALHASDDALTESLQLDDRMATPGLHRLALEDEAVVLTLGVGVPVTVLERLAAGLDAVWLGASMAVAECIRPVARLAREETMLHAVHMDAAALQAMRSSGFEVMDANAANMTCCIAVFRPHWRRRRNPPPPIATWPARRVIVIGAGLAGCAAAHRMAVRGWDVTLIDRADGPARGTSSHRGAALHPHMSPDDSQLSRLTRAGHHYALTHWSTLAEAGHPVDWHETGLLQAAMSVEEAALQRQTVEALGFPASVLRWLLPAEVEFAAGACLTYGGWWFERGGWVAPPDICRAQLADATAHIRSHWNCEVSALRRTDDQWRAFDRDGRVLAEAPVVILANGCDAARLVPHTAMTLTPMVGQLTDLPTAVVGAGKWPDAVISGHGYLLPADSAGAAQIGSTYEPVDAQHAPANGHTANLQRIAELLPDWSARLDALDPTDLSGYRGVRCLSHNRLPHIGMLVDEAVALERAAELRGGHLHDLPRMPGLYGLLGLASRGLTWAALGAELVACQIEGEPLPVERDLAGAIDPARELLHRLRHAPGEDGG